MFFLRPDIFLLDDPTSSLDNKVTLEIMKHISTVAPWNHRTFVITTSNLRVLDFCNRVIFIDKGRIAFNGPVNEIRQTNLLKKLSQAESLKDNKDLAKRRGEPEMKPLENEVNTPMTDLLILN